MKYAIVKNNTVLYILNNKPMQFSTDNGMVFFNYETTDEELMAYGIFPYEETNVPSMDGYNTNNCSYEILEDKVIGTWTITYTTIPQMQQVKKQEIQNKWSDKVRNGSYMSVVLNMRVDARRNEVDNDAQNLAEIINLCEFNPSILPLQWKGVSETTTITSIEELKALRAEMAAYAVELYQSKFAAYAQLEMAETPEEIMEIEL